MAITFTTGETFPDGASVVTAPKLNSIVNDMTMEMATAKVLGRATAGTGAVEELATTGSGSVVLATSPTLVTPALGTPASGVVTNLTGTASININGTVGATTPAAGAFTTLSASGNIRLANAFYLVGRNAADSADIQIAKVTASDALEFGSGGYSSAFAGSVAVTGTLSATGVLSTTDTTDASSSTTGSLKTAGGMGIAKKLYVGTDLAVGGNTTNTGTLVVSDVTDSSSSTTGSVKTAGGLGVAKKLYVGTDLSVAGNATMSTGGSWFCRGSGGGLGAQLHANAAGGGGRLLLNNDSATNTIIMSGSGDSGNGSLDISGGLITAGQIQLAASTTTRASLQIFPGTAPSSPNNGDIWCTATTLHIRLNGVTKTVTLT